MLMSYIMQVNQPPEVPDDDYNAEKNLKLVTPSFSSKGSNVLSVNKSFPSIRAQSAKVAKEFAVSTSPPKKIPVAGKVIIFQAA